MLQQAYRERPIEGRLSDFKYVPLPNQRGGTAGVDNVQRDLAAALLLTSLRDRPTAASHHAAAKYYLMNHQFEEAQKQLTAALELDPQNAKIHNDFGAALLEEGQRQSSADTNSKQLELYGRSLEHIEKAIELDKTLLEALFNRALVYQLMRPSQQAIQAWKEYLEKDGTSPWAQEARQNIKLIEQQLGSADQKDKFKRFLEALQRSDENAARAILSTTYTSAGNEIMNHLIDAAIGIEPFNEALDPPRTWAALDYLAKLESEHSNDRYTSDLATQYRQAEPTQIAILAKARYHMRTGYAYFEKSSFRDAIQEYNKAKLNYERAKDTVGSVFVEYRLAHCYVLLPDPQKAELSFKQLLVVSEANRYHWLAAQCLFGLAHASADSSEYSQALEFSSQALQKFEQAGDVNGIVKCLTQLADFNQAVNQVATALGYLSRTLRVVENTSSDLKQTWGIFNQIGFSMSSLQLHAAALFYQKEALRIAIESGIPLMISRSYGYVGSAYAAMKMYPEAVKEASEALEIGRRITGSRAGLEITAQASNQLGDIYRAAGRCDQAIDLYDQSLQLYQRLNFDLYAYVAHKGKLHCFITTNQPTARYELNTVLKLSESYRSKITVESQRNSFFDAEQGVYDLAIGYASDVEKDSLKALEYSEQSRARSLLDAVDRSTRMHRKYRHADLNLSLVTAPLRVAEIQKRMPEAVQIVQYAMLDDKLLVWLVTKTEVRLEEVSIKAPKLKDKVSAFWETLNHPSADGHQRTQATELFEILIKPIEKYLDKSKLILIVPDKTLNYLPYAALRSSATAKYLIEEYDLAVAPSGTLFINLSEAAKRKAATEHQQLLSVGDPLFSQEVFKSLRSLPSSLTEARAVADLHPGENTVLVREEATEAAVKREMEKAGVIHLAMHFVLNEQSEMLSGFPLAIDNSKTADSSDGFLQSYEIAYMNLRRTQLVVLSACQTGIEKQYRGEGAVGAARAFFVAGVPTVVASLWPIDSDSAAELMVSFHRHRLAHLPVTQALRMAQIEMLNSNNARYRDPYYWAAFLAIGGVAPTNLNNALTKPRVAAYVLEGEHQCHSPLPTH